MPHLISTYVRTHEKKEHKKKRYIWPLSSLSVDIFSICRTSTRSQNHFAVCCKIRIYRPQNPIFFPFHTSRAFSSTVARVPKTKPPSTSPLSTPVVKHSTLSLSRTFNPETDCVAKLKKLSKEQNTSGEGGEYGSTLVPTAVTPPFHPCRTRGLRKSRTNWSFDDTQVDVLRQSH